MNPTLKDIVKEEIQKLLNVEFIYPISHSKWVSPLVVVPKKVAGKWRIFVDFWELNKATLKDYFPIPFIDQVQNTLSGKKYFSFLDGYNRYNQILIALEDQEGHFPWEEGVLDCFEDSFSGEATHKSTLWCKGFSIRDLGRKGASFQWIDKYLRRAHYDWAHISLLDLCFNLRQVVIVLGSIITYSCQGQ
jgi:hypothetical protein